MRDAVEEAIADIVVGEETYDVEEEVEIFF